MLFLFLLVASSAAHAQNFWEPLPSPIGFFADRVQWDEEGTLYVQSYDSIYLSSDNGDTWNARPLPKTKNHRWQDATVLNKNTLFFDTGRVYRSVDRGISTHPIMINDTNYGSLMGTQPNGTAIYRQDRSFYLTTNAGDTWTSVPSLDSLHMIGSKILLSNASTCIFGTSTDGLFSRLPQYIGASIFGPWQDTPYYGLSITPNGNVYRFSKNDSGFVLYVTTNAAASWDSITVPIILTPVDVISNSMQYYITTKENHLLRGDSSLQHWEDMGEYFGTVEITPNGTLFTTYDDIAVHLIHLIQPFNYNLPIRRSTDGGHTWQDVGVNHQNILQAFAKDTTLYLVTEDGSLYTRTPHTLKGPHEAVSVYDPDQSRSQVGETYFGFHHNALTRATDGRNISTSTDDGIHWSASLDAPFSWNNLTKGCLITEDAIIALNGQAWRSTNSGATWEIAGDSSANYYSIGRTVAGQLWIENLNNDTSEVIFSQDYGETWRARSIPPYSWTDVLMRSPKSYILCGSNVSARTTDDGITWSLIHNPDTTFGGVYFAAEDRYYLRTTSGLYSSSDDGVSWDKANGNLDRIKVNCLSISNDGSLYLATTDGLYKRAVLDNVKRKTLFSDCKVYPLPASHQVTIVPSSSTEVRIYNSLGALVYRGHAERSLTVNTTSWPSGSYSAILLDDSGKRQTKTLIIQH